MNDLGVFWFEKSTDLEGMVLFSWEYYKKDNEIRYNIPPNFHYQKWFRILKYFNLCLISCRVRIRTSFLIFFINCQRWYFTFLWIGQWKGFFIKFFMRSLLSVYFLVVEVWFINGLNICLFLKNIILLLK